MENQQIIDNVRALFVKVMSYDRLSLVDSLNKNGFPISSQADADELTNTSLTAVQKSEGFRNDLAELMSKFANPDKFKSFAPYQNDLTENLNPTKIMGDTKGPDGIFYDAPLFSK